MSVENAIFQAGHLERAPLGTTYSAIVHHVGRLLGRFPKGTDLCIDYTGVGRPVFDMFQHLSVYPTGALITNGATETVVDGVSHVPKIVLVGRLQALLHEGRLKIHKDLPEAGALVNELANFRVQYTAAGNLTFNAREGRHDDLVLAMALACYRAAGGGQRYEGLLEYYRRQYSRSRVPAPRYFIGVDLGQARDPTAVAVVRRIDYPNPEEVLDRGYLPNAAVEARLSG